MFNYLYVGLGTFFSALLISLLLGKPLIKGLYTLKFGQSVRTDGPETHLKKSGTPTMGGIMIVLAATVSTLIFAGISNPFVVLSILVFFGFGLVGFIDDWLKIKKRNADGLSMLAKYSLLSLVAGVTLGYIYISNLIPTVLVIPFFGVIKIGIFFIVLGYFAIVGSSNAVNFTDGLDGLVTVPVILCSLAFAYMALHSPFIPGIESLFIPCLAVAGAAFGFLFFNYHPAKVFMGDVGSLALGGFLGVVAVLLRQEITYVILGGLFVLETLSVMIQITYFKYTKKRYGQGRRFFLMAPLHHHFEQKGLAETAVIYRFWFVALVFTILGVILFHYTTLALMA